MHNCLPHRLAFHFKRVHQFSNHFPLYMTSDIVLLESCLCLLNQTLYSQAAESKRAAEHANVIYCHKCMQCFWLLQYQQKWSHTRKHRRVASCLYFNDGLPMTMTSDIWPNDPPKLNTTLSLLITSFSSSDKFLHIAPILFVTSVTLRPETKWKGR